MRFFRGQAAENYPADFTFLRRNTCYIRMLGHLVTKILPQLLGPSQRRKDGMGHEGRPPYQASGVIS